LLWDAKTAEGQNTEELRRVCCRIRGRANLARWRVTWLLATGLPFSTTNWRLKISSGGRQLGREVPEQAWW